MVAIIYDLWLQSLTACCVFRKAPEHLITSPAQRNAIFMQFWNDLSPLFSNFPGDIKPDVLPNRISWMEKLNFDLKVNR